MVISNIYSMCVKDELFTTFLAVCLCLAVEENKMQRASECCMSIQCKFSGGVLALGYHDALCPRGPMAHANRGIKNDLGLASLRGTLNSEDVCRKQCDRGGKYELGVKAIGTGRDLHDVLLSSLCPQDWKLLEHRDLPLYSVPSHA